MTNWEASAKTFNKMNKTAPDQDVNNWFVNFNYCRMVVLDEALDFQKSEESSRTIYEAMFEENQLNLGIYDGDEYFGEAIMVFQHSPSGLLFKVTEQDAEDYQAGKPVWLYGFRLDD